MLYVQPFRCGQEGYTRCTSEFRFQRHRLVAIRYSRYYTEGMLLVVPLPAGMHEHTGLHKAHFAVSFTVKIYKECLAQQLQRATFAHTLATDGASTELSLIHI